MSRFLKLVWLLGLLMTSPWPARALPEPQPASVATAGDSQGALEQGLELYRNGQFDDAIPLLRGFIIQYPDDPELPRATQALADSFLQTGQPEDALLYLQRLPADQLTPSLQLTLGEALVATGATADGRRQLLQLDPKTLSDSEQGARLQALARADAELGRPLQALVFLHQAVILEPTRADALLANGHALLQSLDAASLDEAAFMLQGSPLGQDARLQQAERAARRGDAVTAQRQVEKVLASAGDFPFRRQAAELYRRLTGKPWLQRAIGVLLPLSGKYATFGQLVRRGMELAQDQEPATAPPVRLLFRDIGADPQRAAATVSDLVHSEGVMAIAGPITGVAAEAAASQAQQEGVPLLTLSQRDGLPEIGNMIFRDSLTPRLQAETLARYAVEERGLTRFGILLPDSRAGREMAEEFSTALADCGGQVMMQAAYPPDATDFRRQIRQLMGQDPDARDEESSSDPLEDLFVPEPAPLPFQALFIPDYADKVGLIAPQLPYYGIEGVPLFGINGWDSPELVRTAGPYVAGAVFVDGFFAHSPYPFVRDFVTRYRDHYGEEPTILEAQGYDVAGILMQVLENAAVTSRDEVRLALQQLRNYPGVTGATSFNAEGEAEKVLFLLQVQHGNIVQIN